MGLLEQEHILFGGRREAVEEIVRFLRSRFENVNFIVSGEAKSAGTILVLSGDEIHMTKSGSLGPIDAQIRIGRSIVSAFDYLEWLNKRKEEAEESGRLNPLDATIISQISPGELNLVHHALKFAEDLVIKWLPKYKFKNWNITETRNKPVDIKMKKKRAKEIAQELMNHAKWRTHMRSIKIDDLEKIGLKISKIDQYPLIAEIIYRIQSVIRLLFSSTTIYKIFATADNKLFRTAAVTRKPVKIPKKLPDVVKMDIPCQNCGKDNKLYAKFTPDPKIDEDFKKKGVIRFPKDNKLTCDCGFEIDLGGIRNEIERKINKKIID